MAPLGANISNKVMTNIRENKLTSSNALATKTEFFSSMNFAYFSLLLMRAVQNRIFFISINFYWFSFLLMRAAQNTNFISINFNEFSFLLMRAAQNTNFI